VNGVCYNTLTEAIANADGGEVTLLKDVSRGEALAITTDVTINFNGFSYTVLTPVEGTQAAVTIAKDITVRFKGQGRLINRAGNAKLFAMMIYNMGTLIIDEMTVDGTYLEAIDMDVYTIKNTKHGTLLINSGAVTTSGLAYRFSVNMFGSVTKAPGAQAVAPGGYHWNEEGKPENHSYDNVFVVGATLNSYGYTKHKCECGNWYGSDYYSFGRGVATVGEYYYRSVQQAINAADGQPVVLLKDLSGNALTIRKDTVLNLAGFTYTANVPVEGTSTAVLIESGATLTLTGDGKLAARAANKNSFASLILNEGSLKLNGVTLDGTNLDKNESSFVVLNKGTVSGESNATITLNNSGTAYGIYNYVA
jgi:hypothetical protein